MSTVLPAQMLHRAASTQSRTLLGRWIREPLLHFVLLGALLFTADHLLASRTDDPHRIVLDSRIDAEAIRTFTAARGRAPGKNELFALRRVWLDNEVLYREGLAMQLDKGDPMIRERVIFKALSVVDASTKLPHVDDMALRQWFEAHRAKYDAPARYSFQEAVLSDDDSDSAVQAFVAALNSGTPGDAKAGLRVFSDRPLESLVESYGPEFIKALGELPVGEWRALPTRGGLRAMRLQSLTPPKAAAFEQVSNAVHQDWVDATLATQRSAAVSALTKKYTVSTEAATP